MGCIRRVAAGWYRVGSVAMTNNKYGQCAPYGRLRLDSLCVVPFVHGFAIVAQTKQLQVCPLCGRYQYKDVSIA